MSEQLGKQAQDLKEEENKNKEDPKNAIIFPIDSKDIRNCKLHVGVDPESSLLFQQLDQDIAIHCLLLLSRSDYGSISLLNKTFRSLIRTGKLYQLRRKMGIVEHWIYFSRDSFQWEAFDPNRGRWMHLPGTICDVSFMCSYKESLAVGTELLVFGKDTSMAHIIYKYSHLTNMWSLENTLNTPRSLFGCASLGEIAILAGGRDPCGNILSSAELYNSDTRKWESLPNMKKARQRCSAVFMDGKFYVIGGIADDGTTHLTCGEEFDIKARKWRDIPNILPTGNEIFQTLPSNGPPPLIAVVKNVLYVADYAQQEVKKYVKENNSWVTIGRFPEQVSSINGWGIAFRACGDMLVFLGGPIGGSMMEINAWVPNDGALQWNQIATKESSSFVHYCTVMGC
ncbi:hypothetical protein TSUD_265030 [Trifolium subterraneum]|uniref:F-box domain-containing protein n=1 Tax=Trifolium subterraneum TaxID=3900 RepID=A0A2Z6MWD7_TRISU|nr:hypothetical protein TSUD_265030 [Trifolium subterraneum]